MAITSAEYQPTALTGTAADAHRPVEPDRTGIVFVHGIGVQRAAETFLDWSGPIVDLLADWRADHGFPADPVIRSEFSFSSASQPYLELDIPASAERAAARWVITEAWWAAEVRPKRLGAIISYVLLGLPKILAGLRDSYVKREADWDARLATEHAAAEHASNSTDPEEAAGARIAAAATALSASWRWVEALDSFQRRMSILAFVPALAVGSLVLLAYAALQLVPIERVRRFAVLRQADTFMADWFGDLPSLIEDRVQSANIRARLAHAIDRLTADGCGRVVVVAHSGGAIITLMTLLDPAYADRRVDKVVTLGQGLSVAWRLTDAAAGLPPGHRLGGDLVAVRPELRWADYWATYDPATAGALAPPSGTRIRAESRPITNRMNIVEDHETYWANDEGFLVALLRHLDTPDRPTDEARFFREGGYRIARIEWRRQRVGVLAAWRWATSLSAVALIAASSAWALLDSTDPGGPGRIARDLGLWFDSLPWSAPIIDIVSTLTALPGWPVGGIEWSVGALLIATVFLVAFKLGGSAWGRWDAAERRLARRRILQRPDRRFVPLVAASPLASLAILTVVAAGYLV